MAHAMYASMGEPSGYNQCSGKTKDGRRCKRQGYVVQPSQHLYWCTQHETQDPDWAWVEHCRSVSRASRAGQPQPPAFDWDTHNRNKQQATEGPRSPERNTP